MANEEYERWLAEENKAEANATRLTPQDDLLIERRLKRQRLIYIGGFAVLGAAIDYFSGGNGLGMAIAATVNGFIGGGVFWITEPYLKATATIKRKGELHKQYNKERMRRGKASGK